MLVTLPNIEKNNIIYIVTFKGQRSWTPKIDCFQVLVHIFKNFQTSPQFYFLIVFTHIWKNCCW